MNFSDLIQAVSFDTFFEVITLSPRKVRESLFSHYGIKAKNKTVLKSVKEKKQERIKALHAILKKADKPKELDFLKELFRNWLFHQRLLLKTTLDFLGIKNEDGLTEDETDFFKEIKEPQVKDLVALLQKDFSKDAILIYFSVMEVPFFLKYLNS